MLSERHYNIILISLLIFGICLDRLASFNISDVIIYDKLLFATNIQLYSPHIRQMVAACSKYNKILKWKWPN